MAAANGVFHGAGEQAELDLGKAVLEGEHRQLDPRFVVPVTPERGKVGVEALMKHAQACSTAGGAHGLHDASSGQDGRPLVGRESYHNIKSAPPL